MWGVENRGAQKVCEEVMSAVSLVLAMMEKGMGSWSREAPATGTGVTGDAKQRPAPVCFCCLALALA